MSTNKKAKQFPKVAQTNLVATSADVLKSIRQALHRDATDDPEKIKIELLNDKVILRGYVRSIAEKEAAGLAGRSALGISEVENKLLIEIPAFLF
jgi:osmotically-inducible protein OsmY